ncbi:MAG: RNA pseudouridine synthase [Clostridia bacterium]|nr:RNA pseudouridine synthase [Clostridia bacterium]
MNREFTMEDVPILHEDNHILVVVKPQNIPTQADKSGDLDLLTLLKGYIKDKYNKPGEVYLGLVHRLDRPTGGVMVFARTSKAAARLSESFFTHTTEKKYLAVINGELNSTQGTLVSWLKKNALTNTVYVATSGTDGAKRAELDYKVLQVEKGLSLIQVQLGTGRSHQIRVQLASQGNPICGDVRYGGDKYGKSPLALWAYQLVFAHPVTQEKMVFVCYPPEIMPFTLFDIDKYIDYFHQSED